MLVISDKVIEPMAFVASDIIMMTNDWHKIITCLHWFSGYSSCLLRFPFIGHDTCSCWFKVILSFQDEASNALRQKDTLSIVLAVFQLVWSVSPVLPRTCPLSNHCANVLSWIDQKLQIDLSQTQLIRCCWSAWCQFSAPCSFDDKLQGFYLSGAVEEPIQIVLISYSSLMSPTLSIHSITGWPILSLLNSDINLISNCSPFNRICAKIICVY